MSGFEAHWEVLPLAQRELWPQLPGTTDLGFVLYGGTAVALRLGHRSSVDFDFFTEKSLDRAALLEMFPFVIRLRVIQEQEDTISMLAPVQSGVVKVSFFGQIGFWARRHSRQNVRWDPGSGLPSRFAGNEAEGHPAEDRSEGLSGCERHSEHRHRVGGRPRCCFHDVRDGFQPSETLKALGYFEGGDLDPLTSAQKPTLTKAISKIRHIHARSIVSRTLSGSSNS